MILSYLELSFFEQLYRVGDLFGGSGGFAWQSKLINAAYMANSANLALFSEELESEPEEQVPGFEGRAFSAACEELVQAQRDAHRYLCKDQ